jgi:hypothetical protein
MHVRRFDLSAISVTSDGGKDRLNYLGIDESKILIFILKENNRISGVRSSVIVKALCCKPEACEFETRSD